MASSSLLVSFNLGFPKWPSQVDDDGSAKHFPQQFGRTPARQAGLRSLTLALRRHLDAGAHENVPAISLSTIALSSSWYGTGTKA